MCSYCYFLFFGVNGYASIFKELHAKKNKTPADMFYLGKIYQKGEGVKRDYKKAAYWYEKSSSARICRCSK